MKKSRIKNVALYALAAFFSCCLITAIVPLSRVAKAATTAEVSSDLTMEKGASVLLREESGLSFSYEISNYSEEKNYGMLIVPFDYLDKAGISLEGGVECDYVSVLNEALNNGKIPYAPIVREHLEPLSVGGRYVVKYSIKNIIETNYARKFFGIGFEVDGNGGYKYAVKNDNVRSVFEVANLAVNKLHFGSWDENDESSMEEKTLLENNETVLNNFITKSFDFVYGANSELSISFEATCVDGEVVAKIDNDKESGKEAIELAVHWNYSADEAVVKCCENETLKGVGRGKTQVTAQIGAAITVSADAVVLKDNAELEIFNNSNANFFDETLTLAGGAFGFATLNGGSFNNTTNYSKDTGYVGFKNSDAEDGKFTLDENGVYTEFYFTGNNMPNVEFFASNISGSMWKSGSDNGFVVTNGCGNSNLYQNFADYKAGKDPNSTYIYGGIVAYEDYFNYYVSYYDKYGGGHGGNAIALSADGVANLKVYSKSNKAWSDANKACSSFSMWTLMQDETQNWHYVVGMYKTADGKVFVDAKLYKVGETGETLFAIKNEQIKITGEQETLTAGQEIKGYIVAHSAIKGSGDSSQTKLSYKLPYAGDVNRMRFENATFNSDGSVTLKSGYITQTTYDAMKNTKLGYVALGGSYKVGTLIDFYFKGSNMPLVSMFTKYVTDNITNDYNGDAVNNGFIISNGMAYSGGSAYDNKTHRYEVYGPKRIYGAFNAMDRAYYVSGSASSPYAISMTKLATMPDQNFKYTIGIYAGEDGKLKLLVDMDKLDENGDKTEDYFDLDVVLYGNLTSSAIDGDRIIVYGALNGGTDITFSYGSPYTK